ncbi:MAG: polysaccharide deacetylase [Turicibacter sp.]|nr:polysaccharide deacetylase [Turicibacter sp.]
MKKRKRKYKLRFYIFFIGFILIALITTIYLAKSIYQSKQLDYTTEEIHELSFKSTTDLTKWHNKETKYVYITFDDSPSKNAPQILDILKQYNVPGTFFVLGTSIRNNSQSKEILNRMVAEGHYIGLHSMTHDKNILYGDNGPANFVREMKEIQSLISNLTNGFQSELCRAPYGTGGGTFTNAHVDAIEQAGIKCWDWDVDTLDWKYSNDPATVFQIFQNQMQINQSKKDLVVLFHEKASTLVVLPQIIEYFQDLGYEFSAYHPDLSINKMFFKIH